MEYLKITAGVLLLVQVSHLASIQSTTKSQGWIIPQSWLREPLKNTSLNIAVSAKETELDPRADGSNMDSSGIPSGSIFPNEEEEGNVSGRDKDANEGSDDLPVVTTTTVPPVIQNDTTKQPEFPDTDVSLANATTDLTNSDQFNMTDAEEEFNSSSTTPQNSTTPLNAQNSTSIPDSSNHTDLYTTTSAPDGNATQESTPKPDEDTWLTNTTEPDSTIVTTTTTTTTPETTETTTMPSSTTVFSSETTGTSPTTTTMAAPITPDIANKTEKGSAAGSSSERGLDSEHRRNGRNGAWGAVLGTAVAVAIVGLVAYVILKKKHQKGFSHRKLVEEFPSDPVHRLENSEPLDLNFGGSAYYNPGLQGDNIQMSNLPGRQRN